MHLLSCWGERQVVFGSWHCIFVLLVRPLVVVGHVLLLYLAHTMERLLLFVALLTGIALVSLDWSWMQFPTAGLHMSRQASELLCRRGAYFDEQPCRTSDQITDQSAYELVIRVTVRFKKCWLTNVQYVSSVPIVFSATELWENT
jgi:hypothetical protein